MPTKKTVRKKGRVTGPPATIKAGEKTYKRAACSRTKTDAKQFADKRRKKGQLARVVQNPSGKGYCVYTYGRAKA